MRATLLFGLESATLRHYLRYLDTRFPDFVSLHIFIRENVCVVRKFLSKQVCLDRSTWTRPNDQRSVIDYARKNPSATTAPELLGQTLKRGTIFKISRVANIEFFERFTPWGIEKSRHRRPPIRRDPQRPKKPEEKTSQVRGETL